MVILQHPRERDMPIGTARMASLSLVGASLRVGMQWTADQLADVVGDPARPPILLAPGPNARDILHDPPPGPVTLIVIDGTWSQARSLVRRNPFLQTLPRYAFATPEPSQYRIRREPKPEYVSTLEAVMHVLGVLERDPVGVRALLEPMRAMIDAQLHCQMTSARRTSYRRPRAAKPRGPRVPDPFADRFDDLVCVVGEANAWPYSHGAAPNVDELVHWVAHRPSTGETFERVAAPIGALSPNTVFHTALDEARLRAGVDRESVVAEFSRFLRPRDVVCAWGHYSTDLFAANGGSRFPDHIDLRAVAHRLANRKIGSLEEFGSTIAPTGVAPIGLGRAGRRLAMIVEIVRAWHGVAAAERNEARPLAHDRA